ncbi:MAG: hypothetical protein JSS02_05205 [Planctomycetes bacterium]|nr:hypothetical protein [Planctomycetota bacterium]
MCGLIKAAQWVGYAVVCAARREKQRPYGSRLTEYAAEAKGKLARSIDDHAGDDQPA